MKEILREKINSLIAKRNMMGLKDIIALLEGYQHIEGQTNQYMYFDYHMHLSNVDLWYIVSISDIGGTVQETMGFNTQAELLKHLYSSQE